jgi:hypothetical protein
MRAYRTHGKRKMRLSADFFCLAVEDACHA